VPPAFVLAVHPFFAEATFCSIPRYNAATLAIYFRDVHGFNMKFYAAVLAAALTGASAFTATSSSDDDKITSLPDAPAVDFDMYSGYVTLGDEDRHIFYWYPRPVACDVDPITLLSFFSDAPIIVPQVCGKRWQSRRRSRCTVDQRWTRLFRARWLHDRARSVPSHRNGPAGGKPLQLEQVGQRHLHRAASRSWFFVLGLENGELHRRSNCQRQSLVYQRMV